MFNQKTDFWVRKMYLKPHFEREFSIFTEYPPLPYLPPLPHLPHLPTSKGFWELANKVINFGAGDETQP